MDKTCSTCKETKDCSNFGKRKGVNDGYNYVCKTCKNKSARKRYLRDIEKNRKRALDYYHNNKKHCNTVSKKRRKERKKTDLLYRLKTNTRVLVRHYFVNNGYSKTSKSQEIVGCTWEDFIVHLLSNMDRSSRNDFVSNPSHYHLDHIIPISYAKDELDVILLNHYTNFQLLTARENIEKSNKYEESDISSE
jgi:hypothetical protein